MLRGTVAIAYLVSLCLTAWPVVAQSKSSGVQLGVDVVRMTSGRTVRGAIVQRSAEGRLTLVVRRAWLEKTFPDWAKEVAAANAEAQRAAWQDITARVESLLTDRPAAPRLSFFLRQESERLTKALNSPPTDSEFVWLELEAKQVAQVTPAPQVRQRIALWGWHEQLADVETRDVTSLAKELQKAGIPTDASAPDLSSRLPARPQSDREWAARLAILDYTLQQPFDLQGTEDAVFPTTPGTAVDRNAVLPAILQRQVQTLLSELAGSAVAGGTPKSNDRAWLPGAIRVAEQAGVNGFRATRVDVDLESGRATVTSEFVAQVAPKQWVTLWQTIEVAHGAQARPEQEAQIAQDPQVKAALEAVRALGLTAEGQVNAAVRVGAATMAAQQAVDRRFMEFRERYAKRLDGPLLAVP